MKDVNLWMRGINEFHKNWATTKSNDYTVPFVVSNLCWCLHLANMLAYLSKVEFFFTFSSQINEEVTPKKLILDIFPLKSWKYSRYIFIFLIWKRTCEWKQLPFLLCQTTSGFKNTIERHKDKFIYLYIYT